MFDRLAAGWDLVKQSFQVLRLDKELLMFPLFSGIACLVVMGTFAFPLWLSTSWEVSDSGGKVTLSVWSYVLGFAFYFVNYFVVIFFNTALAGCAVIRLKGGDPVVRDGLDAAMARLPQIAGWALVSATVGLLLKSLESRSNRVGQLVAGLLGMAWSITTFFVIPVIVIERANPVEAVRRSAAIMKSHWGESLAANFGVGMLVFLVSLLGLIPLGAAGMAFANQLPVLGGLLVAVAVLYLVAVALVSSTLHTIILSALYVYAAEHKTPANFDAASLDHAFSAKFR